MELKFKSDTKQRRWRFDARHFAHPAKMVLPLQMWLVEHYTKPGEWILDPMAGSGTLLVACSLSRNVLLMELEQKFVRMCLDNWRRVREVGAELGHTMGNSTILWGNAREIEKARAHPYMGLWQQYRDLDIPSVKSIRRKFKLPLVYEENIKDVMADCIITSPPYSGTEASLDSRKFKDPEKFAEEMAKRSREGTYHFASKEARQRQFQKERVPETLPDNISELPYGSMDAVITSPPYEGSFTHSGQDKEKRFKRLVEVEKENVRMGRKWAMSSEETIRESVDKQDWGYGSDEGNIGNLVSNSYLEAMLQVYEQCHKILKPEGLLVLVTKNFIRDRAIVRLDEDTIKLCRQASFEFLERHQRKLTAQSFWRTIYKQKYPDAPEIDKEDILIFKK